ncbi:hypothetical protein [Phocaeicola coprocola]|jgi:hypothetical protein|uniref:hypothetical protein n=1 Tax=Phocaeicola coprocola TaxID=310298 RepID=UPI00206910D9|nr:MAG TPA: hypothetical protein [Caudoviricetes sp.]
MAELTFKTNIRRDKWPRWMKKLHEYMTRVTQNRELEPTRDEYLRLKMIMEGCLGELKNEEDARRASIHVFLGEDDDRLSLIVMRSNLVITSYYIE